MKFSCDGCGAQYMISDDKVGPNGVKIRCKKCGNVVSVKRAPSVAPEIEPELPVPESHAAGGTETTLERELGDAFDSVFGGGSLGLSSEGGGSVGLLASEEGSLADLPEEPNADEPASEESAPSAAPGDDVEKTAASAEETADWYVALDEKQVGPLEASAVKARWEAGEIGPDTLAWRPGMADWVALSTVPEMAQYLAPVPNGGARTAAASSPGAEVRVEAPSSPTPAPMAAVEMPAAAPASASVSNGVANGAANGHDTSWRPSAASALAALANEEIASLQKPEPKPAEPAAKAQGGGSLLEQMDLPDGGVDPTNVLPLPIKGLDPTGESALPRRPAPAAPPETADLRRLKKSATRSILAIGAAMAVLFAAGIAIVIWKLLPGREAPPAPVAQAPAVPAAAPQPAPPAVAPQPTPPPVAPAQPAPSATASAAPAPTPAPAAPVAAVPAPAPRAAAPQPVAEGPQRSAPPPEREAAASHASRTHHATAKAEPPPRHVRRGQRLASAERAPEPPPAAEPRRKSGGDPLLDAAGDDDVERELSGRGSRRSVYVPPAMGSGLPDSVSVSQINEAVVGQKTALMRCIEKQKSADPDTRGTLKVRWIISGDGGVRDVRLLSHEFARQPIASCITSVVRGIRFPRSRTTGQEVVFPFKF
jgi:predicted Zn finger-like uncharacterized protein